MTHVLAALRPIAIALLATALLAGPVAAEHDDHDDDHAAGTATVTPGSQLAAFLREGTCDAPGAVVERIGDREHGDDAPEIWTHIRHDGEHEPGDLRGEDEDVGVALTVLTGSDHILAVQSGADERAAMVACGAVPGEADAGGEVSVELSEVAGSGVQGRARLVANHDDSGETEITIGIWATGAATPEATPGGV